MHLGEISFCDKIGYNLKSDELKKKLLTDIEGLCKFKIIQKHYEKYTPSIHNNIVNNPHLLSLRSNGNPYLLFLTKHNFVNQCIFIDKKIQQGYFHPRMIIAKFRFDNTLFEGTLFDGEMVKDVYGNWIYIINDLIVDSGVVNNSINLVRRVNRLHEILEKSLIEDDLDVCTFQIKRYFHYHESNFMLDTFRENLPYTCRGLYFKPLFIKFKDILYNFDESLIKKVSRTKFKGSFSLLPNQVDGNKENTHDVNETHESKNCLKTNVKFIQKTTNPDVYEVYESCNAITAIGIACVNNLETSKLLRSIFLNTTPLEKKKMECEFIEKFNKWKPLKLID